MAVRVHPAHITVTRKGEKIEIKEVQTVEEHCRETAVYAAETLRAVGLGEVGKITGLLHDMGKSCENFESYLKAGCGVSEEDSEAPGKSDYPHSHAGARYLIERREKISDKARKIALEYMAEAILAHHGLHDMIKGRDEGYVYYIDDAAFDQDALYAETKTYAEHILAGESTEEAEKEMLAALCHAERTIRSFAEEKQEEKKKKEIRKQELAFSEGMLFRLMLSALVKADHRSTREFMNGAKDARSEVPDWAAICEKIAHRFQGKGMRAAGERTSSINQARQYFSDRCAAFGREKQAGIYRLNLPTGAGKTMSSLRLAAECMREHQKSRIFFIMPFISIIEQNAGDIREVIGEYCEVLECHSNIVLEEEDEERYRLLADSWESDVVITSLVQFLEAAYKKNARNLKRFSSFINSVIVIDEVQSVPMHLLSLFNGLINFLAYECNCMVILCSATQPCFEEVRHRAYIKTVEGDASEEADVIPDVKNYLKTFQRTQYHLSEMSGLEELSAWIRRNFSGSMLVICNKKREAEELFDNLGDVRARRFFVTTDLCPEHRRRVIAEMRAQLRGGQPVLCISTSVLEAGVDLSFRQGVRIMAGVDQAIQTGGRVNRNGELGGELADVWVVRLQDEKLLGLPETERARTAFQAAYAACKESAAIDSEEMVTCYYRQLYKYSEEKSGEQDHTLKNGLKSVYSALSDNEAESKLLEDKKYREKYRLHQAFQTAGKKFQALKADTVPVLAPYGEAGKKQIERLGSLNSEVGWKEMNKMLKDLQRYSVNIHRDSLPKMREKAIIYEVCEGIYAIDEDHYDENDKGLLREGKGDSLLLEEE